MRRGTRVGQAYIALTADGSGINQDIADSLDDADFDKMADKHGEEYANRFESHIIGMEDSFGKFLRNLGKSIETDDSLSRGIRAQVDDAFTGGALDSLTEGVGRRLGATLGGEMRDEVEKAVRNSVNDSMQKIGRSSDFDIGDLIRSVDSGNGSISIIGPILDRATAEARKAMEAQAREMIEVHNEALRENAQRDKAYLADRQKVWADGFRLVEEQERAVAERVQSDRERIWADGFRRNEDRERESAAVYQALLDGESAALARSPSTRVTRLRDDSARRRAREQARYAEEFARMLDERDERERQSASVYQALLDGESAALERSLAERAQAEDDATRRRARERARYEEDFTHLLEQADQDRARATALVEEQALRDSQQRDTDRFKHFRDRAKELLADVKFNPTIDSAAIKATMRRLAADLEKQDDLRLSLNADLPPRERARIEAELEGIRARINVSVDEDALNKSMTRAVQSIESGRGGSNLGNVVGRMLGAGSRSNLLNFFGKSLGNIVGLVDKVRVGAGSMFRSFYQGFTSLEEGAKLTQKLGAGFTGMGSSIATLASTGPGGLIALAIAVGVVVAGMGILVTVMGALLAVVTALASTIASALVGALLVLAPAMAAVVVGAGLLTAAFTSMTNEQKAFLSASFAPLKAELTGLGQLMITQMIPYFATWSKNLQNALYLLTPLAAKMGDAFGRAGNIITSSLGGAGFQKLAASLGTFLPNITVQLSAALGRFLNGLAGTFAALMPLVNRFANYLADVAGRFSEWANSASGQNSIVDFADRAVNSLKSLWGFLKQVGGLIADVLFSAKGQETGNSMFDDLAGAVKRFRNYIADGRLEKWFDDGAKLAVVLGDALKFLGKVMEFLYSSKIIDAIAWGFGLIEGAMNGVIALKQEFSSFFSNIGGVISNAIGPLEGVAGALGRILGLVNAVTGSNVQASMANLGGSASAAAAGALGGASNPFTANTTMALLTGGVAGSGPTAPKITMPTLSNLQSSGTSALNKTYESAGGNLPDPKDPTKKAKKYKNPYTDLANSLIQQAPSAAEQMRKALQEMNRQVVSAISGATSGDRESVVSALSTLSDSMLSSAQSAVESAQSTLSSRAEALGSATSKKSAKAALRQVRAGQRELQAAMAAQARVNNAMDIIDGQRIVNWANVDGLLRGIAVQNGTLADYAEARTRVTEMLADANQKLTEALALRDNYYTSVADGVRSFTSLLSAQARTINGVQQALTANDILQNLRDKLTQARAFQDNLRILLARGLSNDAYKQLVDAGIEAGGAYAQALVEGGAGSVSELNGLVEMTNQAADILGAEASTRLYQAGVDAAQGLVDGLNSLSGELDAAATRLGASIAQAVKNALGIASPSKVMKGVTRNVGQTLVDGLGEEERAVRAAASRLGASISVSPEVAKYAQEQADRAAVSQNQPVAAGNTTHEWNVSGFSEDPVTAAQEMMNEMTGRLA